MENDHYVNSHLEAGENLPLGHCSSYPWLPRAFPSTPLTSKSLWQSSQPTSMAAVTGRGLWEPHCGCVIHQPPQPQQHSDSSPMLLALWQISPGYRSYTSRTELMTPMRRLEMLFYMLKCEHFCAFFKDKSSKLKYLNFREIHKVFCKTFLWHCIYIGLSHFLLVTSYTLCIHIYTRPQYGGVPFKTALTLIAQRFCSSSYYADDL